MNDELRSLASNSDYLELRTTAADIAIKDVRMTGYDKLFPNETLYFLRAATSLNKIQEYLTEAQVQMKNHLFQNEVIDKQKMKIYLQCILLYYLEVCDGLDLDPIDIALKAAKMV